MPHFSDPLSYTVSINTQPENHLLSDQILAYLHYPELKNDCIFLFIPPVEQLNLILQNEYVQNRSLGIKTAFFGQLPSHLHTAQFLYLLQLFGIDLHDIVRIKKQHAKTFCHVSFSKETTYLKAISLNHLLLFDANSVWFAQNERAQTCMSYAIRKNHTSTQCPIGIPANLFTAEESSSVRLPYFRGLTNHTANSTTLTPSHEYYLENTSQYRPNSPAPEASQKNKNSFFKFLTPEPTFGIPSQPATSTALPSVNVLAPNPIRLRRSSLYYAFNGDSVENSTTQISQASNVAPSHSGK